nr:S24 family peptidase [Staphylococcus aureus]
MNEIKTPTEPCADCDANNIISLDEHREKEPFPVISAMCAGIVGETLQDEYIEHKDFYPEDIPEKSKFATLVNGDSMEPIMRNGTYAFIEPTHYFKDGMIALITLNGDSFVKKVEKYEDTYKLVSANPKYDDIIVTADDDFRLIGKVVQ